MKQAKAAGAARERQVRNLRRDAGMFAIKTSDSAIVDVLTVERDDEASEHFGRPLARVELIEVKGNVGNAWMHFRAAEREALRLVAEHVGATALLIHWPPREPMREIPANEWPECKTPTKEAA